LLIGAGEPLPLPEGSDQTYPFRSHAEYFYLAGDECAKGVLAFDPRDGETTGWVSFVPVINEAFWETVYSISALFGVPRELVRVGWNTYRFWD
jgi:hypothetical protein